MLLFRKNNMLNKLRFIFGKQGDSGNISDRVDADIIEIHKRAKHNVQKSQKRVDDSNDLVKYIENTVSYRIALRTGRKKI
jgi:hypothetical protein